MSYGLTVLNTSNTIQINQDLVTSKLVFAGSTSDVYLDLRFPQVYNSIPILFIRSHAVGAWIGSVVTRAGALIMCSNFGMDYAVFSPEGSPITDNSTQGLEVYRSDGSIAYTSKHKHPQITHIHPTPLDWINNTVYYCDDWTYARAGWNNMTFPISGYTSMPWFLGNPLVLHGGGVGPYTDQAGWHMAKVNSGYTSVTYDIRYGDWPFGRRLTEGYQFMCGFDYYGGFQGYFGVGRYD